MGVNPERHPAGSTEDDSHDSPGRRRTPDIPHTKDVNMTSIKHFAVLSLAAVASVASAAIQPLSPITSSTVSFDAAAIKSNSFTASALGGATYNSTTGILSDSISNVSIAGTASGPATVAYDATSGIALSTNILFVGTVNVNLTNFSYSFADNTLYGDVFVTALGSSKTYASQSILIAGNESGTLSGTDLNNLDNSASARSLNMTLSSFTLSSDLEAKLGNAVSFVSWLPAAVKSVNVISAAAPAIPEPSTYALMALGLVGIAAISRRRQAANS
jgi:hypothetical protein